MLAQLLARLDPAVRGPAFAAGGVLGLLLGNKVSALGLLAQGVRDIEAEWRARNPDFTGGVRERWALALEQYEATHRDPRNRRLHAFAVPVVIGGVTGLLVWPRYTPFWVVSAGAVAAGLGSIAAGDRLVERDAPVFAPDILSHLAGPVHDLMNLRRLLAPGAGMSA